MGDCWAKKKCVGGGGGGGADIQGGVVIWLISTNPDSTAVAV